MRTSARRLAGAAVMAAALWGAADPGAHAAGRCGDPAARPWCDTSRSADDRADLLLRALTRAERIRLLAGDDLLGVLGAAAKHTGTSLGVPRVGLPTIYYSDGPVGPRQGKATGMPSPIGLAASFDPPLARRHAEIVGDEVKHKGNDVVFAPAMNIERTPLNGRTFEYFGEDPFLSGRMAVAWTQGVQSQGVIANAKHFAVNNQEGAKAFEIPGIPIPFATRGSRFTLNATLDERTLREIYLPQFEAAVKEGGVGTIMCAYPRVNGQFACENRHLLTEILRDEWGFDGYVLTDYGANKTTERSLKHGLDLDIWPGLLLQPPLVELSIAFGRLSHATVDTAVRRQLRTLFAFGALDRDAYANDPSQIDQEAHDAAAADIAADSAVLLRNEEDVLPLDADDLDRVAVIGPEADTIRDGGGSSKIDAFRVTTPLGALRQALGASRVVHADGRDADAAARAAAQADVAIVVVGDRMTEGVDKPCMGLNCAQTDGVDRDALVARVAAANPRTVVVLQTGGPVLTPWRDDVAAILEAWYPGQNGGTAIARILLGDAEPGGHLPNTFPVAEADHPTAGDPQMYPGVNDRVRYKEGVLVGYRWFDERGLDVAYPFGFGLSYTSFSYDDLQLRPAGDGLEVRATVTNAGAREGSAVAQVYVGQPDPAPGIVQPPFQLKGFEKVRLAPGASREVTVVLDRRAFSHWGAQGWEVAPGCYEIGVGAHSRSLPLRGTAGADAVCGGASVLLRST